MDDLHSDLRALGRKVEPTYDQPDAELLERFPNPAGRAGDNPAGALLALRIDAPEFTSLCPITGQPDWARIVIRYQPDAWCVESKSLKLYLGSYRNCGTFHEAAVTRICNDLVALLEPHWLVVEGRFTARGGIPFWPTAVYRSSDRGAVEGDHVRLQERYDVLEPLTERMDRAARREDVV